MIIPTNEPIDPTIPVRAVCPTVIGLYGNARSFRQASGEFCQQITDCDADVWAITESHLKDDPVNMMTPPGYNVVSRNDRSKHGGDILLGAIKHLLCNPLDLKKYNIPNVAELDGFELHGIYHIGCYAPNPFHTNTLIDMLIKFLIDHPGANVIIMGDLN